MSGKKSLLYETYAVNYNIIRQSEIFQVFLKQFLSKIFRSRILKMKRSSLHSLLLLSVECQSINLLSVLNLFSFVDMLVQRVRVIITLDTKDY